MTATPPELPKIDGRTVLRWTGKLCPHCRAASGGTFYVVVAELVLDTALLECPRCGDTCSVQQDTLPAWYPRPA